MIFLSCASRKEIKQFQDDMLVIRLRLDALQSENRKIMQLLQDLNTSIVELQKENNRTKADLISEMSSLKDQTQFLQSLLDDTGNRMSKLIHRVEDRVPSQPLPPDTTDTAATALDNLLNPDAAIVSPEADLDPKALYDATYLDLSRGDYDLALQGFMEYLRIFPNSDYADNAQYWIGEIYYAKEDFQAAYYQFENVTLNYPQGDKVSSALLKMGYCLIRMGEKEEARTMLNRVIEQFPNTAEARLARTRLEEL